MPTFTPLHERLGIEQRVYDALCEKVPSALLKAIKEQETPEAIKAAAILNILDQRKHDYDVPAICLVGVMVEQAYNAAVLQSQQKKPLFGKRKAHEQKAWRSGIESSEDKFTIKPPQ